MISLIGLSFADFSILHSFFTLVNIFFHLFLKPLSSSLECSLNLPYSSSFVKPFFTFFYLFLFFSKIKKEPAACYCRTAVLSSPLWCLTSVFGMGTGVSIMLSPPDLLFFKCLFQDHSKLDNSKALRLFQVSTASGQVFDLLVSVRWTCHHAYTPDLSTLSSLRGLTYLRNGKSHLEVGFTLRCLQRLSLPYLATQLCHWRDNWSTIDMSIPVLSY